ncbi:MAG: methionine synthase [Tannerella sp.]|jgi:5-methyltetrahydrofolate--homocysteine methyltransferase|nr:methionine synthase [Tannerella sp.]
MKSIKNTITELLAERILILDGGLGTMIQTYNLTEEDYRGNIFIKHEGQLRGNYDVLNITCPDVIREIHKKYIETGVDIFTTNTFSANAVSMEDYDIQSWVREINLAAGRLCRQLADKYMFLNPDRQIFVAGSIGPTNKTASMSPDVNNPAFRAVSYIDLYNTYYEQVEALIDGGVDLLLFETVFDTLNAKAGLEAAVSVLKNKNLDLPIMLSLTISGKGGRTLSGQTLEAFIASVQDMPIFSIGLNCSFGAAEMKPYLKELSEKAPFYISAYPNAGLPNKFGKYDETPETMAVQIKQFIYEGLVNIIGGCCGTTPAHIAKYQELVKGATPRKPLEKPKSLWLSGLEMLEVKPENNYVNIGERCNVAGSRKFLRLIKEKNYEEALTIARKQVEDGAQILDINMDDGLLDAVEEMKTFLNLIASEPDIARVPVMVDSSKWEVIEQGLMCLQGKSIVNSISLKEGEQIFLKHAEKIRLLGAATVVMAFDEKGQADTFVRKIEICARAYKLLTEKIGFSPQNIIFDPNVLAIATGMLEHNGYGMDFIKAVGWIKKNLPYAKVSGGISNLSFSFRGNDYIRESMHAVFLYHAIKEGMDMGIVNPSSTITYEDIEPQLRDLLEDVILARRPEAAEELIRYAQFHSGNLSENKENDREKWREGLLEERIEYALIKGIGDFLEEDLNEALQKYNKTVEIIDGPLMHGMNRVGELFGEGKMFLPQVVKTARTMKKAVALLQPAIETEKKGVASSKAGKIVFATVKGDVHDIGKNICSIVLACNNYEVIDLGVMVPAEKIIETVRAENPDILCLSGLITPSLEEMKHVADEMRKAGMTIPIMIGGATTSKLHTALKIAPHYDYPVIHATDASQNPLIVSKLLNPATKSQFISELNKEYEKIRNLHLSTVTKESLLSFDESKKRSFKYDWSNYKPVIPNKFGINRLLIIVNDLMPYINWSFFFSAWKLNVRYGDISVLLEYQGCREEWINKFPENKRAKAEEVLKLYCDARYLLNEIRNYSCKAVYGLFRAVSIGEDIFVEPDNKNIHPKITIPALRQQIPNEQGFCLSLADYIIPCSENTDDYIGFFAVTTGKELDNLKSKYQNDNYKLMLLQTVFDRLAEAAAEYLHEKVRKEYWGYASDENLSVDELFKVHYQGIRPATGYPSIPDQSLVFELDKLLNLSKTGISITESGAMFPTSSVVGLYFSHPDSRYFMVGKISEEQLINYAERTGKSKEYLQKFLVKNFN